MYDGCFFFIKQRVIFCFNFIFWKILGCVCNRTQVTKTLVTQSTKVWTVLILLNFIFWRRLGSVCNRTQVTKTLVTQSTKGWTALILQCMENDMHCPRAVFHKWYNKSNKLLIFGKIFQWWLFENFEFSNYQTLINAYINPPYLKNRIFQRFWKKNFRWKEKKPILSYPGLNYAHKS